LYIKVLSWSNAKRQSAFALFFPAVLTMWLVKFAVWCFIKRLMHGRKMNIAANVVFVILILTYIALNIFNLTWCAPINSIWNLSPDGLTPNILLTTGCVFRVEAIVIFDGVMNTFTDFLRMHALNNANNSGDSTSASHLESPVTMGIHRILYSDIVHQNLPHCPVYPWLSLHCCHNRCIIRWRSEGFPSGRQFYNMVQRCYDVRNNSSLHPTNPHPLPQTIQSPKFTRTRSWEYHHNTSGILGGDINGQWDGIAGERHLHDRTCQQLPE
jgi:hypothetical protein